MQETQVQSLSREDLLQKDMAMHSSILAWRIPWAEDPGWLQSMGSQRVRHDWARTDDERWAVKYDQVNYCKNQTIKYQLCHIPTVKLKETNKYKTQKLNFTNMPKAKPPNELGPSPTPRVHPKPCLLCRWCVGLAPFLPVLLPSSSHYAVALSQDQAMSLSLNFDQVKSLSALLSNMRVWGTIIRSHSSSMLVRKLTALSHNALV